MAKSTYVTNDEFSKTNQEFLKACENADITATSRQASKYRNKKGLAFKNRKKT